VFQILAVGRPLITSDSPAMRELVQPGEAIRLTRPGDPGSLAEQLVELAQVSRDPARQPVLAAAAAQMPAVDVETIAAQLRVCLESLA
jgi:glycosyltransferase involved in cell wall biosynthesis